MFVIQTQIAFFFKDYYKGPYESFSLKIKEKFGNSKQTLQIPIPEEESGDIPRVTLNYEKFSINISKSRIDIITNNNTEADNLISSLNSFDFAQFNLSINRIGFIRTFFHETEDLMPMKKMLNSDLENINFDELNLRFNQKIFYEKLQCNHIEKIDKGSVKKNEKGQDLLKNGILIQKDLNNVPTNGTIFSDIERLKLINWFKVKAEEFLIEVK